MLLSRRNDAPLLRGYARSCMRGRIDRPSTNCLGGDSGVGDAAEVGALLSVRAFVSLGELTPDDVHVQVLHGKIDSNDVLTGVTVQDLDLAESYDGGRYRFNGPIVLDRGGAFGNTVRVIPRNDLLTSVAELGVVAIA